MWLDVQENQIRKFMNQMWRSIPTRKENLQLQNAQRKHFLSDNKQRLIQDHTLEPQKVQCLKNQLNKDE